MRRWLEPILRRLWREEAGGWGPPLSALLRPAEVAYREAVTLRNRAYDRGWFSSEEPVVPVVSVGNLLVGGTGKTPVSAWIARLLSDAGRAPALVIRGYGGDEEKLHRRWNPDVPVFSGPDRSGAVSEAASAGCRSAVLDDGFQHRSLRRTVDLALLPVEGPWRVRLLPRGPYREPLAELSRADRVVLVRRTGGSGAARAAEERLRQRFPELPVSHLRLAPEGWTTPHGEGAEPPTGPLLAVTGIARPELFRALVETVTGCDVELMEYPDHHAFTARDREAVRERTGSRTVVTTEKDAVRLHAHERLAERVRVLRLRVVAESGGDELRHHLLDATSARGRPEHSTASDEEEGRSGSRTSPGSLTGEGRRNGPRIR